MYSSVPRGEFISTPIRPRFCHERVYNTFRSQTLTRSKQQRSRLFFETGRKNMESRISFEYAPLSRWEGRGKTTIRRPREIAYYSYDDHRELLPLSEAGLKYYCPPLFGAPGEVDSDHPVRLSEGFASFQKHDDTVDEHLGALLDTLQAHEVRVGQRVDAHFVTWRGVMTKILTAPYERYDGFALNATLFQDTIYVELHHGFRLRDHEDRQQVLRDYHPRPGQPSQALMQYWGYKFETLSTLRQRVVETPREVIEGRSNQTVNNIEQYCSIVQTGLGDTKLVIAGEVDAVLREKPENPEAMIPYVELKTSKICETRRDIDKYEDKLLKYWAQSFLLGVPYVVVGFRDHEGELLEVRQLETHQIPGKVRRKAAEERREPAWDANACILFAEEVLALMKKHITVPGQVWTVSHVARSGKIEMRINDTIDPSTIVKPSFRAHREKM